MGIPNARRSAAAAALLAAGFAGCGGIGLVGKRATKASVRCSPSPVPLKASTHCTATVTDTTAINATPYGVVRFSTNSRGSFSPNRNCALGGSGASSRCSVLYRPSGVGSGRHELVVSYLGDATHASSDATVTLEVTPSP